MSHRLKLLFLYACYTLIAACSPVKATFDNQYALELFSAKTMSRASKPLSLLVSMPDATAGYQSEQMIYTDKAFELSHFAHNAWVSSPANMLYPLITQSLQQTHVFFAVASGPDADKTDYRLDTQLIELKQDFTKKPSEVSLTARAVLTHIPDNRTVVSRTFQQRIPCPEDTPYGGVLAANQAVLAFTEHLTAFVVKKTLQDART